MFPARVIVTAGTVTTLGPPGSQDNGLITPKNETSTTRVMFLPMAGEAPTVPPTPLEIYSGGKTLEPREQLQVQQVNDGFKPGQVYLTAIPVAPPDGDVCDRGSIIHKLDPVLDLLAPTGRYVIGDATTFTAEAFTQPAASATVTVTVCDPSGFADGDRVYAEIGCMYTITIAGAVFTLTNLDEPAAAVSTSA